MKTIIAQELPLYSEEFHLLLYEKKMASWLRFYKELAVLAFYSSFVIVLVLIFGGGNKE
ncbi:hypothetical protein J7J95_00645 [bacterium]|nr:hypothetical protein [bacterium]